MRRQIVHSAFEGDEGIRWRPSLLSIAISVLAWIAITILAVRAGIFIRGDTFQLQAWDPDGLDYQVEVQIEGWGFRAQEGFRVLSSNCEMRCQVFHREDHTVEPEVEIITQFPGNRQVVLEGPDGRKTLTLEWGSRKTPPGTGDRELWDSTGRFIDLDHRGVELWLRQIKPGSFEDYWRIWPLLGWSMLWAIVPIVVGWLVIGFTLAFVKESRMRHRNVKCPVCGYDLHAQIRKGCPECGWNREQFPLAHSSALSIKPAPRGQLKSIGMR